jgi:hypothetical protein
MLKFETYRYKAAPLYFAKLFENLLFIMIDEISFKYITPPLNAILFKKVLLNNIL